MSNLGGFAEQCLVEEEVCIVTEDVILFEMSTCKSLQIFRGSICSCVKLTVTYRYGLAAMPVVFLSFYSVETAQQLVCGGS